MMYCKVSDASGSDGGCVVVSVDAIQWLFLIGQFYYIPPNNSCQVSALPLCLSGDYSRYALALTVSDPLFMIVKEVPIIASL